CARGNIAATGIDYW
nr:immunoglobulin heavy chain junction region [Macaca mulatta]MOX58536.1 immunoglobulin heavy chain junction region [Macaca mulatta]MOX58624.1 immunoglobulin heavy chain junction region [Macaca mulatta]MOX58715.1 immunoglobulin heavy chain junction region [Macaca mulatta]MOX58924.1 immunoglobulin heavy chain junction region [Macaca mulatta]